MPLAALLDLVAQTVVHLFVPNDVTAQHPSHDTLELFHTRLLCLFAVLYFIGFRMTRIRFFLVLVVAANLRWDSVIASLALLHGHIGQGEVGLSHFPRFGLQTLPFTEPPSLTF
jgi:hypothetical protein